MKKNNAVLSIERTSEDGRYVVHTAYGPIVATFGDGYLILSSKDSLIFNGVAYTVRVDLRQMPYVPDAEDYRPSFNYLTEPVDGQVWAMAVMDRYDNQPRVQHTLTIYRQGSYGLNATDSARMQVKALLKAVTTLLLQTYPLAPLHGKVRELRDNAARKNREIQEAGKTVDRLVAEHAALQRQIVELDDRMAFPEDYQED